MKIVFKNYSTLNEQEFNFYLFFVSERNINEI